MGAQKADHNQRCWCPLHRTFVCTNKLVELFFIFICRIITQFFLTQVKGQSLDCEVDA
jgi:hypothetical protein